MAESSEDLFERMFNGSANIINLAQVMVAENGSVNPGDVVGLLMAALGRYCAMVESKGMDGDQAWEEARVTGLKPMFVSMFDVQRRIIEREKKSGEHIQ